MSRTRSYSPTIVALGVVIMILVLAPIVFIVLYSFNKSAYLQLPPHGLTWHWYQNFFGSQRFRNALASSLLIAFITTPVTLAIAVPTAIALVRYEFAGRQYISTLLLSPLLVPGVVTGIAFLGFFTRVGVDTGLPSLIIAMICFCLPYAVRTVLANMEGLDATLEDAARNLGASRFAAFLNVTLPQLKPGLLAGGIFVFVEALDNFSISVFLTNLNTTTLPVETYGYIRDFDDPTVAASATLLIAVSVVLVLILQRAIGLEKTFAK